MNIIRYKTNLKIDTTMITLLHRYLIHQNFKRETTKQFKDFRKMSDIQFIEQFCGVELKEYQKVLVRAIMMKNKMSLKEGRR